MGRYMRKNKVTMEVSPSLGVRTRARTLAMAAQQGSKHEQTHICYLELRSRKLEKIIFTPSSAKPPKSRKISRTARGISVVSISRSTATNSSSKPPVLPSNESLTVEFRTSEVEASCGDNAFDHDGHSSRDSFGAENIRRVRESTPSCTEQDIPLEPPGSSSRVRFDIIKTLRKSSSDPPKHFDAPSPEEIEDFFADRERLVDEKTRLCDRYNYDFVNDVPLPGRYEWTASL